MQLSIAKKTAYDLLKQENLLQKGWNVGFDDAKTHLGICDYRKREIRLSRYFIALNPDEITIDTIRHEVAHALTPGHKHGEGWKAEARRLGANPASTCGEEAVLPDGDFHGMCLNCDYISHKYREPKNKYTACSDCCRRHNGGAFTEKYLLTWKNAKTGELFIGGEWTHTAESLEASSVVDESVGLAASGEFGAISVIEAKDIGRLPDFRFDDYDYKNVPEGVYRAFLDLKMWRKIKDYNIINTYWQSQSGEAFVLGVWENSYEGVYETADKRADIEKLKIGCWYEIIVMKTPKGYPRLQSAKFSS